MQGAIPNKNTLERIYPTDKNDKEIVGHDTFLLHEERYHYAGKYIVPGEIGDIACGVGYGSYLLATKYNCFNGKITAIDTDVDAINFAKLNYRHPGIDFIQGDVFSFAPTHLFDSIVSLETIEHLPHPAKFVSLYSSYLKKGGKFIASVPITPSMDANPYHLHDFTVASFKNLFINARLKEIDSFIQIQKFNPFRLFKKKEGRAASIRKNIIFFYFRNPRKFFLRLKSVLTDGFTNKYLLVVFEKK